MVSTHEIMGNLVSVTSLGGWVVGREVGKGLGVGVREVRRGKGTGCENIQHIMNEIWAAEGIVWQG